MFDKAVSNVHVGHHRVVVLVSLLQEGRSEDNRKVGCLHHVDVRKIVDFFKEANEGFKEAVVPGRKQLHHFFETRHSVRSNWHRLSCKETIIEVESTDWILQFPQK